MTKPKKTTRGRSRKTKKKLVHTKRLAELTNIGETAQEQVLKIVRQQNRDYVNQSGSKKRKQSEHSTESRKKPKSHKQSVSNSEVDGDESESDIIVKRCYEEWLQEENEKHKELQNDDQASVEIINDREENDCDSKDNERMKQKLSTRKGSDPESENDQVAERRYKKWRQDEYDSYNVINRKTLLSKIDMFESMLKPKKNYGVEECCKKSQTSDCKIQWTSPMYIIQHIRKCVLRHQWAELSYLLPLLFKHHQRYHSFAKEITFLTTLMSFNQCSTDLLQNLELCFVKEENKKTNEFEVWYVEGSRATV